MTESVDWDGGDVAGFVMRVRRMRDLSQRDLAAELGLDASQVSRIETSQRRVDVDAFVHILSLAGLRLAVLDVDGNEVAPVPHDVLRDNAGRRMPAHLDVRPPSDPPRYTLVDTRRDRATPQAWYHHRPMRDRRRAGSHDRRNGGVDDQPTRGELDRARWQHQRARDEARGALAGSLLATACACRDGCWRDEGVRARLPVPVRAHDRATRERRTWHRPVQASRRAPASACTMNAPGSR